VQDYISRPFDERTVRRRVINTIMLFAKQKELSHMVADQMMEKENGNQLMIEILSNIVEFRNGESGLHVLHIRTLTELFLKALLEKTDKYDISRKDIPLICNASALHDIGKIVIPEEVLNKPGRFTDEEFAIMRTHSMEGARLLEDIPMRKNEPLIQLGYQICRWHHERYDGKGYPDGLKGEEIPIVAQVVALADVYDALTSKRVYKDAYSHEKAVEMILNGECGIFNPILMECLKDISDTLEKELSVLSQGSSQTEILGTVEMMMEKGELSAHCGCWNMREPNISFMQSFPMKYSLSIRLCRKC
jgi:putative two-component system response regulator